MPNSPAAPQLAYVVDTDGNIGTIDHSQLASAIQSGQFRMAQPQEIQDVHNEQTYGGLADKAKAFGQGALEAGTFGLGTAALLKSGFADPEAWKAREEVNPVSHGVGELAGVVAPALLGGGEGALGSVADIAGAPVNAVTKAGEAVSEAARPMTQGIADALVNKASHPVINKILSQAGSEALGSAVQGAAYGLGQSVNEWALGDPGLNAEKVMANVGYGALFAGALGSVVGAAKGSIGERSAGVVSELDKPKIEAGDLETITKASDLSPEEKEGIISGLTKQKGNAQEIRDAAGRLGAPVLESQVSDSELVHKADSLLLNGPTTYSSMKRQALYGEGVEKAEGAVQDSIGAAEPMTKAQVGESLKTSLAQKVSAENEPISQLYDEIKKSHQAIPLSEKSAPTISRNIRALDEVRISPSSPQASLANRVAGEIENLKTVDDVKQYRSMLRQSISPTASSGEKHMVSVLDEKLRNLEENSVVRFAETKMKTGAAKDRILSLLDQRQAANAQYKAMMEKVQNLSEVLGKKRVYGPADFLHFLDDLTPEKVADKLFTKNNSGFLDFFAKEFPDEMKLMAQYQKGHILEESMKTGKFSPIKVINQVNKLEPEIRGKIFNAAELQKLKDAELYLRSIPPNINPSGTSHASAFREFFEHPTGALVANARDFALERFVKMAGNAGQEDIGKIAGLSRIERMVGSSTQAVKRGAKAVFQLEGPVGYAGSRIMSGSDANRAPASDENEKKSARVKSLQSDPEHFMNQIETATRGLYHVAPNMAGGLSQSASTATAFLGSKIPQYPDPKPFSPPYKPSKTEMEKFSRYYDTVENPAGVLDELRQGTIAPEHMEALQAVYPKLLGEMRTEVMDQLTKHMNKKDFVLPYGRKLALSMFLGSDLDDSLSQQSIASNQMIFVSPQTQQPSAVRPTQKGLGNIKTADRSMTAMQSVTQRGEA